VRKADFPSGSNVETIQTGNWGKVYGIAIHPSSSEVYWVDAAILNAAVWKKSATATSSDSATEVMSEFSGTILGPYAISLDTTSSTNYMYYADTGLKGIYRADLDGFNEVRVVDYAGSAGLRGVALDLNTNSIYWTEQVSNSISKASLSATYPVDGASSALVTGLGHPHGIVVCQSCHDPTTITITSTTATNTSTTVTYTTTTPTTTTMTTTTASTTTETVTSTTSTGTSITSTATTHTATNTSTSTTITSTSSTATSTTDSTTTSTDTITTSTDTSSTLTSSTDTQTTSTASSSTATTTGTTSTDSTTTSTPTTTTSTDTTTGTTATATTATETLTSTTATTTGEVDAYVTGELTLMLSPTSVAAFIVDQGVINAIEKAIAEQVSVSSDMVQVELTESPRRLNEESGAGDATPPLSSALSSAARDRRRLQLPGSVTAAYTISCITAIKSGPTIAASMQTADTSALQILIQDKMAEEAVIGQFSFIVLALNTPSVTLLILTNTTTTTGAATNTSTTTEDPLATHTSTSTLSSLTTTTTDTSTTLTSVTVTTTTSTTLTTTIPSSVEVKGSMTFSADMSSVADPVAAVSEGVTTAIASYQGVPESNVDVTVTEGTRRLKMQPTSRRLSSSWVIDYSITDLPLADVSAVQQRAAYTSGGSVPGQSSSSIGENGTNSTVVSSTVAIPSFTNILMTKVSDSVVSNGGDADALSQSFAGLEVAEMTFADVKCNDHHCPWGYITHRDAFNISCNTGLCTTNPLAWADIECCEETTTTTSTVTTSTETTSTATTQTSTSSTETSSTATSSTTSTSSTTATSSTTTTSTTTSTTTTTAQAAGTVTGSFTLENVAVNTSDVEAASTSLLAELWNVTDDKVILTLTESRRLEDNQPGLDLIAVSSESNPRRLAGILTVAYEIVVPVAWIEASINTVNSTTPSAFGALFKVRLLAVGAPPSAVTGLTVKGIVYPQLGSVECYHHICLPGYDRKVNSTFPCGPDMSCLDADLTCCVLPPTAETPPPTLQGGTINVAFAGVAAAVLVGMACICVSCYASAGIKSRRLRIKNVHPEQQGTREMPEVHLEVVSARELKCVEVFVSGRKCEDVRINSNFQKGKGVGPFRVVYSQVVAIAPASAIQGTADWADIKLKANDLEVVKPKAIRCEQLLALSNLDMEDLVLEEKLPEEFELNENEQPPFVRLSVRCPSSLAMCDGEYQLQDMGEADEGPKWLKEGLPSDAHDYLLHFIGECREEVSGWYTAGRWYIEQVDKGMTYVMEDIEVNRFIRSPECGEGTMPYSASGAWQRREDFVDYDNIEYVDDHEIKVRWSVGALTTDEDSWFQFVPVSEALNHRSESKNQAAAICWPVSPPAPPTTHQQQVIPTSPQDSSPARTALKRPGRRTVAV